MRLLKLPLYSLSWYVDRIGRIRKRQVVGWAVAEVICMTLSLATLALMLVLALLRAYEIVPSRWVGTYAMPVLVAGAVGYLTNLIAVTMLFRPYGPEDDHPASLVPGWHQGLIPRHRADLAAHAGKQVADRLLTPEVIADEIRALVEQAFEDRDLQSRLRYTLGPMIRERLPDIVDAMTPQIMAFLRNMLASGFSRENLDRFFTKVVDPWLRTGTNQERLVDTIVAMLKGYVPQIVEKMQQAAQEYKEKSLAKRLTVTLAEWTHGLDWDEVGRTLHEVLGDPTTRTRIIDFTGDAIERFRVQLADAEAASTLQSLQERASDFVVVLVEQHLEQTLPEIGHRVADDRRFWRWLTGQGLPSMRPYLLNWLAAEGVEAVKKGFDVAGRVRQAIDRMDVVEVHEMINEASARHLGAIQVLGYVLGLIAGACLLLM